MNEHKIDSYHEKAKKEDWIELTALTLPVLLISIDSTVLYFALPHIIKDLSAASKHILWIIDIYSFMIASFLIVMGSIGDKIGRRKLLIWGSIGFGLASLVSALSTSSTMLIVARAFLGIAGATLMPSTLSIIKNTFKNNQDRRMALGIWAAAFSSGAALGPIFGGILLEHFSWRSVFYINIPIIFIFIIVAPIAIKESKSEIIQKIDIFSALLSLITILPIIYSIKMLTESFNLYYIFIFIFGVIAGGIFLHRQKHTLNPLIDLKLFNNKTFSICLLLNFFSVFALIGGNFILVQFIQIGLNTSTLKSAILLLPSMLVEAISSIIAVKISTKYSIYRIIIAGFAITSIGFLIAMGFGAKSSLWITVIGSILLCFGTGISYTLTNDIIISTAPNDKAGTVAAISETSYELGAAIGVAFLGTLVKFIYSKSLKSYNYAYKSSDPINDIVNNENSPYLNLIRLDFLNSIGNASFIIALFMIIICVQAFFSLRKIS